MGCVSSSSNPGRERKQIPLEPASEEDCGQLNPASSWLGQPNPLGQYLLWSIGRRRGRAEEAAVERPRGMLGALFLEQQSLRLAHTPSCGGWHFLQGLSP